jgi:hypothetical protein
MTQDAQTRHAIAVDRAHQAQQLLTNPSFREASEALEAHYTKRWRESAPDGQAVREDAWFMLRALTELRRHLQSQVEGGQMAAFNLRSKLVKS